MFAKFSVKKPMSVLVAVVLVLILGYVAFTSMTTDLLPDINLPYVIVMTTYPGASPEAVEEELTRPIEQQMATLDGISSVTSTSAENYSLVMLEFSQETNMDTITGDIREKFEPHQRLVGFDGRHADDLEIKPEHAAGRRRRGRSRRYEYYRPFHACQRPSHDTA